MTGSYAVLAAADATYAIPLAALIVSAAALVYGAMGGRRSTMTGIEASLNNRLTDLVRQVDDLRDDLKECVSQRAALERENVALMRQVMHLKNGDP
jgi:hypothetical protein